MEFGYDFSRNLMTSSRLMDKQITEQDGELFDLMTPQEEHQNSAGGDLKKKKILASYDFQPIRTVGSLPVINSRLDCTRPSTWGSADSKTASFNLNYAGILEPHEPTKFNHEKERVASSAATLAEIDCTVKKHVNILMDALEVISSRLLQLESRTHHVESSVNELKVEIGNDSGNTDGKLRRLENILGEVQTGMQALKDKRDITGSQLQVSKLAEDHCLPQYPIAGHSDSQQQTLSPPQLPTQPPISSPQPNPVPALPALNAPPQQNPYSSPFHHQLAHEPYFPPPVQSTEPRHQQYQMPAPQTQPPPALQYQLPPQLSHYSHKPPQHLNPSAQLQRQSYPPNVHQPQPPSGPSPLQQFHGYNPPVGPGFSDLYPYSASPSHYLGSSMNSPFSSSPVSSGGSNFYSQLPKAQILPEALPTGSSSGGLMRNGMLFDDVVDEVVHKVATMGFSRDQVREAVRSLTENGHSVDLNVVLDKLMNDAEIQRQMG